MSEGNPVAGPYCRRLVSIPGEAWAVLPVTNGQYSPATDTACRAERETHMDAWPEDWVRMVVDDATVRRRPPLTAQGCAGKEVPAVPTGAAPPTGEVDSAVLGAPGDVASRHTAAGDP